MKLYLVQHGEAKNKDEDPDRSLTKTGAKNAKTIAAWLGKQTVEVSDIFHSLKKRADQTAVIFADRLAPQNGVTAITGLNPNDDILPMADKLEEISEPIMIIGHLPFLARLASYLLTGNQDMEIVSFTNTGVVCLERHDEKWCIHCVVRPDMLPEQRNENAVI